jgi:cobalt-precorrin 5A hydrolase
MKIAVVSFTKNGGRWNSRIIQALSEKDREVLGFSAPSCAEACGLCPLPQPVMQWTGQAFHEYDALIFVGATGIAVRSIAPYVKDKWTDPAVLVMDEKGQFVIPVLSGHVGGANELAAELAEKTGARPVITTATDIQHCFAVDVFAVKNQLIVTDREKAKQISADILKGQTAGIYFGGSCFEWQQAEAKNTALPKGLYPAGTSGESRIAVDYHQLEPTGDTLHLIPENFIWIGIGCKKGTDATAIDIALQQFLEKNSLSAAAVAGMASIDLKREEEGILTICKKHQWAFSTFSAEELMQAEGVFSASDFVRQHTGVDTVCERAAVCAAGKTAHLIVSKQIWPGITLAAAVPDRRIRFE